MYSPAVPKDPRKHAKASEPQASQGLPGLGIEKADNEHDDRVALEQRSFEDLDMNGDGVIDRVEWEHAAKAPRSF